MVGSTNVVRVARFPGVGLETYPLERGVIGQGFESRLASDTPCFLDLAHGYVKDHANRSRQEIDESLIHKLDR